VALAAALSAERCDIYTDVDGVYSADPRRVKDAHRIDVIDYEEMVELATSGAQVMHPRAVEIGARYGVPIRVLSSFRDDNDQGTLITKKDNGMEGLQLTGLACEGSHVQVIVRGLATGMHTTTTLLQKLAEGGVSLDMVSHAEMDDGRRQLTLTVREDGLAETRRLCEAAVKDSGGTVDARTGLTRLAIVGSGMYNTPGVYARSFKALDDAGIEVHAVGSSAITIIFLVDSAHEETAVRVLHEAFDFGSQ
jgi:aspartate kinase